MDKQDIIPKIFKEMDKLLYTDSKNINYMWLYDMEWITLNNILKYKYEPNENKNLIQFAHTGGGDKWCWYINNYIYNDDYPVVLCYHDDFEGEIYAKNTIDAIFRQIIDFVSNDNFYLSEESFFDDTDRLSQDELNLCLEEWYNKLYNFFTSEQIKVIEYLMGKKLSNFETKFGTICSLIDDFETELIINKYLKFDDLGKTIKWIN